MYYKLFDALVAPICEWWGFQGKNDIELFHRTFCKMVLNVPSQPQMSQCMDNLVGCLYMYLRKEDLMIKYWLRLTSCFDISSLLWDCYNYHKLNSTLWLSYIQSILNKIGLSYVFGEVNMLDPSHIISVLKHRLIDQYLQK